LTPQEIIAELAQYEARISGILSRFRDYQIADPDADIFSQVVIETADLLTDALGSNSYSTNIMNYYNYGVQNPSGRPSQKSVTEILAVIRAAHTRLTRNPEILNKKQAEEHTRQKEKVFIIHGRDEAKWRELKDIIANTFRLTPIILSEQPDIGKTSIEKFEHYAETCSYAIAVFTPDDEVKDNGGAYLQARPNVIYELGWFCGRLERSSTMLLLKEGTSMFSDFGGIIQKRFKANISELEREIRKDLTAAGILE
jgi:predicted nucleotide-binding protein